MKEEILWHNLSFQEVVKILESDINSGLTEEEVEKRGREFGLNKLPEEKPVSKIKVFLSQFKSPLIYILMVVGMITLFLERFPENLIKSGFVFATIFINAVFGSWKEYKSSKIFEELKQILKTKAVMIRNGFKKEVFQEEIVPGDIILISSGDRVPADGRLIEAKNLTISEAVLTGEWLPASKQIEILAKERPLADRDNMIYSGCLVESGEGKAVAVAIGENTEMGKISLLIKQTKEEKTPLQKKLTNFTKLIAAVIILLALLILGVGIINQRDPLEMFETAAAVVVGGIPEALPIVMTLNLAIGMERLSRKKGLIRHLSSVETLGSTSVICTDKTKTLTKGEMEINEIVTLERNFKISPQIKNRVYSQALKIANLSNSAFIENPQDPIERWKIIGDPTEKALIAASVKSGIFKPELEKNSSLIERLPFDSAFKYQAALYKDGGEIFLYVSGAPEVLLDLSSQVELEAGTEKLDEEKLKTFNQRLDILLREGKRVISIGYLPVPPAIEGKKIEELVNNIIFVALISLNDPLRKETKEAFKTCKEAGLKSIIITGDHRVTAKKIADELKMKVKEEEILEGMELDRLSDEELSATIEKIKIYARSEPKHKMKIIRAWQKKGEVVAMTGDGVNDAPALKGADIGIALGSGTDVAKEASDLVLLDDSFNVIIKAIEEGRVILENLRKAIACILANSFTEILLVGTSIVFGFPLPILWTQILWNNIVEDSFPSLAFAFEPKDRDIIKRKPERLAAPLLSKEAKLLIFFTGFIDQSLALFLFWILWEKMGLSLDYVRTMVFGSICLNTAFFGYCFKNFRKNIWQINILNNKSLLLASLLVFIAFALAIYFPPLQTVLGTVPLGIESWLLLIAMVLFCMFLIEISKWFFIIRKGANKENV